MLSKEELQERDKCLENLKITTYKEKKGYVFISYKSDDWRQVFEEKVFELQNRKMRVYSDKQFDDSNHPWLDNMEKNIKYSSAVILFISKAYLRSYATFIEVLTAIKYKKQIVPVYLSEVNYFEELEEEVELEDEIVTMNTTEAEKLKGLIQNKDNPLFSDIMESIKNEYIMKLGREKFSVMDLVSSFRKILKDSGKFQDNYFYKPIDTLIKTINEIIDENEKLKDVFEVGDSEEYAITDEKNVDVKNTERNINVHEKMIRSDINSEAELESIPKHNSVETFASYEEMEKQYSSKQMFVIDILACFISKYSNEAAHKLGYKNMSEAFEKLAERNQTSPNNIKNIRDTFDPFFENNNRAGWWQKKDAIETRRIAIIDKMQSFSSVDMAYEFVASVIGDLSEIESDSACDDVVEKGSRGKSSTGDITYSIYGREYTDNQSNMMLNVFAKVLKKHPEKVNTLSEQQGMNCVSKIDYTDAANRGDDMPTYFRMCEFFPIEDGICVGTSYSIQDKMKKIARLFEICGEDRSIFQSETVFLPEIKRNKAGFNSTTKQDKAVEKKKRNFLDD